MALLHEPTTVTQMVQHTSIFLLQLTCFARFRASSRERPLSIDRWTTFSHRDWTLTNKFLIRTTSCFWLRNFNWFPVWSSSIIWSRWAFTSLAKTLCSSIWERTVFRIRLGGEAMFKLCSARVSQLINSCREFWNSVARLRASSSFD